MAVFKSILAGIAHANVAVVLLCAFTLSAVVLAVLDADDVRAKNVRLHSEALSAATDLVVPGEIVASSGSTANGNRAIAPTFRGTADGRVQIEMDGATRECFSVKAEADTSGQVRLTCFTGEVTHISRENLVDLLKKAHGPSGRGRDRAED